MSQTNPLQNIQVSEVVSLGGTFSRLFANMAANPDSITATLTLPDGKTQVSITPTNNAAGSYTVSYPVPASAQTGTYTLVTAIISGTFSFTETYLFQVQ